MAETAIGALVCPAGTVTVAGTEAMPGVLLVSATVVFALRAALMVTVRVPVAPWVMVSVLGWRLAMVGGAALTSIVALTSPPLREAVIWALPTATAVTGITRLV